MDREIKIPAYTRREILKWGSGLGLLIASEVSIFPGGSQAATESTLARARRNGYIRVGFANEAPFAYASPEGKLIGFMPDVIAYIMKQSGVPALEGVLTEFGGLIPGLLANRVDIVGAGLYIRASRCQQATPSNPMYTTAETLAVMKGNPKNLHSYQDGAKQSEVKIGTLTGSVDVEYLTNAGVPKDRIVLFPDLPSAMAGLQAGRIDGVSMSAISLQNMLKQTGDPNLELAQPFADPTDKDGKAIRDYGAVYFRKTDTDLIQSFNTELTKIRDSGKLLDLIAPYGFTQIAIPPAGLTSKDLCSRT